jgi:hypothetical protein
LFLSILGQNTKRESGRKVQSGNINAAKVACLLSLLGTQTQGMLSKHSTTEPHPQLGSISFKYSIIVFLQLSSPVFLYVHIAVSFLCI